MSKESLKIIIKEFHETGLPPLVKRQHSIDFSLFQSRLKKIITITGPRRAGKTYILFQIMQGLLASGMDITDIIYINFEDERILPMEGKNLQYVLDAYYELYANKERPFIFLDEIQNIDNWDKFVRRINEQGYIVFVTGSNSRLLSREIATALRGRTITYEIFPFSFPEFLVARGIAFENNLLYGKKRHEIRSLYEEYFFSGGFPEVAFTSERATKTRILQDYFNTVFYRDIVERYKIKNTELLRRWLNILMTNIASLISLSKVENDFKSQGIKVSKSSLASFARYVEDVFFGFFVEIYSESARKRQANPRKFYLIDQGIHNYLTLKFSENKGRVLENMVFAALRRKGHPVFYYKTKAGYEVDFVVKENNTLNLIQVCYDLENIETFNRERKAIILGMKELGLKNGLILTQNDRREEKVGKHLIKVMPVWEWLLTSFDQGKSENNVHSSPHCPCPIQ